MQHRGKNGLVLEEASQSAELILKISSLVLKEWFALSCVCFANLLIKANANLAATKVYASMDVGACWLL